MPAGQLIAIVALDYMTRGFVQFQADRAGKLNGLSLSFVNGQRFEFQRE